MLDSRNIKTTRPVKSLDHKNLGLFKIIRAIDNNDYELELPKLINGVFPVFHPWLLHLDKSKPLPEQTEPPPPPVFIDDEGSDYMVEEVLDAKIDKRFKDPLTGKKGCLMYKIRYTGYDDDVPAWQSYDEVAGCPDLVADFHFKYPEKLGPHDSFRTPDGWKYCRLYY